MQIGMIGLGRMGGSMVGRLVQGGHTCVVFDSQPDNVTKSMQDGATGSSSLDDLIKKLDTPRAIWLMVPAAVVDPVLKELSPHLQLGDTVIDGGNSHYVDDIRRATAFDARGIHYLDAGVSGGVWGTERGYCLMIGGNDAAVAYLDPIFKTLAPGIGTAARTPGGEARHTTAEEGYLHCGPAGAGHFVKMVHNGIEYALMAAYAEGFNILAHANTGAHPPPVSAETTPLRHPNLYRYDIALPDVAEVWRRGSVIGSWLLDLTARALTEHPDLKQFSGRVSDSGEGRWTANAAIDTSTPAPVLTAALFQRFSSRGEDDLSDRLQSAMRFQFGGHLERPAKE
ncbi:MAG: phosphogluconate dehydrogenase (NAD(+)-dependent, decarboxylating) [Acidobacteriota bacterium]